MIAIVFSGAYLLFGGIAVGLGAQEPVSTVMAVTAAFVASYICERWFGSFFPDNETKDAVEADQMEEQEVLEAAGYDFPEDLVLSQPQELAGTLDLSVSETRSVVRDAAQEVNWEALKKEWEEELEEAESDRQEAAQAFAVDEASLDELEAATEREERARTKLDRVAAWFEAEEELAADREAAQEAVEDAEERRKKIAEDHAESGERMDELKEAVEAKDEAKERKEELEETSVTERWLDKNMEDLKEGNDIQSSSAFDAGADTGRTGDVIGAVPEKSSVEGVSPGSRGQVGDTPDNRDGGLGVGGTPIGGTKSPAGWKRPRWWTVIGKGHRVYCLNDEQVVKTENPFSWGFFLVGGLLSFGVLSFLYLLHWVWRAGQCPQCKDSNFLVEK